MLKQAFKGVITYLSDWRNWLTHSLIGVGILLVALVLPVDLYIRLLILAAVVAFNIWRMRRAKHKAPATNAEELPDTMKESIQ